MAALASMAQAPAAADGDGGAALNRRHRRTAETELDKDDLEVNKDVSVPGTSVVLSQTK